MGVRKEPVQKVAAIEYLVMFERGLVGWFLARSTCDPDQVGVMDNEDEAVWAAVALALGGPSWKVSEAVFD